METDPEKHRQSVALFRYGVIADLVHLPPGKSGLYRLLAEKAAKDHCIPGTLRRRVAQETIRGWLQDYRRGGFDALAPKVRCDAGCARALPQEVADLLMEIKEDDPQLSVPLVIKQARKRGVSSDVALPLSSVHRLLSRHGLMTKAPTEPTDKDRRRFAFERAGELWMSDVMHGPSVLVEARRKRKAYLIGFIDDATRVVPFASFALSENTAAFLPVLEGAIRRRGVPDRLYVDNGSAFRSHHLEWVCAKLGVTLIHARPYQPQGKGKMERWFRTVRMQLLPTLGATDLASLEALNRRLWAWVESEYHHAPHKGLHGETPADQWARSSGAVRLAAPDLADHFLFEQKRLVHKDRTVSLDGTAYEVEAALVGQTVTLRYDPHRRARGIEVWHQGHKMGVAKVVDTYANCFVKRDHRSGAAARVEAPLPPPPVGLSMRGLRSDGDKGKA